MEKQEQFQKEVFEKVTIVCDKVNICCGHNKGCEAMGHVFPSGDAYFYKCGC